MTTKNVTAQQNADQRIPPEAYDRDYTDPDLAKSDVYYQPYQSKKNIYKGKPFRDNIGARNPYAMANKMYYHMQSKNPKSGKTVLKTVFPTPQWIPGKSPKEQLEEILHDYLSGNYPSLKSVTYPELFDPLTAKNLTYNGLQPGYQVMNDAGTAGKKPASGAVKPCPDGQTPNAWDLTGLPWKSSSGQVLYDDPMQGCLADCYFLAALIAVRWAKPSLMSLLDGTASFYYKKTDIITARKVIGNATGQTGTTREIFGYKPPGSQYVIPEYAQSSRYNCDWISFYEKAYAVFRAWLPNQPPSPLPDEPDMQILNFGDALQALYNLTSKKYYGSGSGQSYWTQPITARGQWSAYANLNPNLVSPGTDGFRKTMNPTVAWTFYSGYYPIDPSGTKYIDYSDENIPANHAFAILGTYQYPWNQPNSQNYIILMNPFGPSWNADPSQIDGLLINSGSIPDDTSPGGTRSISQDDGIFGIKDETFGQMFEGFGWVC